MTRMPAPSDMRMQRMTRVVLATRKAWVRACFSESLLFAGALLAGAALIGFGLDNLLGLPGGLRLVYVLLVAGLALVLLFRGIKKARAMTPLGAAVLLDRANPFLDNRLVNAFLFARAPAAAGSAFWPRLLEEADTAMTGSSLKRPVSYRKAFKHAAILFFAVALLFAYGLFLPVHFKNAALRFARPGAHLLPITRIVMEITPGDIRLPAGSPLLITATPGQEIPEKAFLRIEGGSKEERVMMEYAGGAFLHHLPRVGPDFTYTIEAGDFESRPYRVEVIRPPKPARIRIEYAYPDYTGLEPRSEEGRSGNIAALKDTRITIEVFPDRPAETGWLRFEEGGSIELMRRARGSHAASFVIERDLAYRLVLVDESGIEDPEPPRYTIEALIDEPPLVEILEPAGDQVLESGADLPVFVEARDDVGLAEVRLMLAADRPKAARGDQGERVGSWSFKAGVTRARTPGLLPLSQRPADPMRVYYFRALAKDRAGQESESRLFRVTIIPEGMDRSNPSGKTETLLSRLARLQGDVDPAEGQEAALPENPAEAEIRNALETLRDFSEAQQALFKTTRDFLEETPEDFTSREGALDSLQKTEEEWGAVLKSLADDFKKLQSQDFSNTTLVDELVELYSEVELAAEALEQAAVEVAVPHQDAALELAEEITENLERWLADAPDYKKWSMEDPLADYEVPIADLPSELEDIVGDLLDAEESMTEAVEDVTSGWMDSLDAGAGWTVSDGPISNMSAKGITGNLLPNTHEVGGRSGEGRSGRSHGQIVEKTAQGKGGRQTPTRLTPDPYETGRVKDTSRDPEGGATGGGKRSGSGPDGLRGPESPEVLEKMDRLAGRQAQIRQEGEKLALQLGKRSCFPEDLDRALEIMRRMESALLQHALVDYREAHRRILAHLERFKTVMAATVRYDQEREARLPPAVRHAIRSAFDEPAPEEYKALISRYFRSLAGEGGR